MPKDITPAEGARPDKANNSADHLHMLDKMSDEANVWSVTVGEYLAGVTNTENTRSVNLGFLQVDTTKARRSFRANEAVVDPLKEDGENDQYENVKRVDVSPRARLAHLLKKYGDRLLAFEATRERTTVSLVVFDVFVADKCAVYALVRTK